MSYIWELAKSFTKKFSSNSEFRTISTRDEETIKVKKSKTVNFKGIEIIEVESYKQYNLLDDFPVESNEYGCIERCGVECKCNII